MSEPKVYHVRDDPKQDAAHLVAPDGRGVATLWWSCPEDAQWDRDLAPVIEELNCLAASVQELESGGWISVEDRLPEDGEIVVVSGPWIEPFTGYRRDGGWGAVDDHLEAEGAAYGGGAIIVKQFCDDEVTHWMPLPTLPAPPEEQEPDGG